MTTLMWQKDIETIPRGEIQKIQLAKLQKTVQRCYDKVPFYKKIMDQAKVKPEDIKTLADIRRLPLTEKNDLRDNYPFG